ncbi:MAG: hypothetical protein IH623_18230 [Verrucomicrobia bacterium]|nr:hypothetical protein [Verrucomicrobiota bacterium]
MNDNVGRLLDDLNQAGLNNTTPVICTSDRGILVNHQFRSLLQARMPTRAR